MYKYPFRQCKTLSVGADFDPLQWCQRWDLDKMAAVLEELEQQQLQATGGVKSKEHFPLSSQNQDLQQPSA